MSAPTAPPLWLASHALQGNENAQATTGARPLHVTKPSFLRARTTGATRKSTTFPTTNDAPLPLQTALNRLRVRARSLCDKAPPGDNASDSGSVNSTTSVDKQGAKGADATNTNTKQAPRRRVPRAVLSTHKRGPAFVSVADIVAATDATALEKLGLGLGGGFADYVKLDGDGFYRNDVPPAATGKVAAYTAALRALPKNEGVFGVQEGIAEGVHNGHAYHKNLNSAPPVGKKMRRIMREITQELPAQVEELLGGAGNVFVRADEDRPQYLRAVLTGLKGTPYADGAFIFDCYIPKEYPDKPLQMTHVTPGGKEVKANNGPGGFSPNLHKSTGKVCLSLLGTWKGPGWDPKTSNVYQALSTLLWMVLGAEEPYYMEPNHGGWEGTAPRGPDAKHAPKVVEYRERVQVGTARYAILGQLRKPWPGFERVLRAHFLAKRGAILATLAAWARRMASKQHKHALLSLVDDVAAALDDAEEAEARRCVPGDEADGDGPAGGGGGGGGKPDAGQRLEIAQRLIDIHRGRVAAGERVVALLKHLRASLDAELLALMALRTRAVEAWRREHAPARQEAKVRFLLRDGHKSLSGAKKKALGVGKTANILAHSDYSEDVDDEAGGGGDSGESLGLGKLFAEVSGESAAAAEEEATAEVVPAGMDKDAGLLYKKYMTMCKVGVPFDAAVLCMKLDALQHPPAAARTPAGLKQALAAAGQLFATDLLSAHDGGCLSGCVNPADGLHHFRCGNKGLKVRAGSKVSVLTARKKVAAGEWEAATVLLVHAGGGLFDVKYHSDSTVEHRVSKRHVRVQGWKAPLVKKGRRASDLKHVRDCHREVGPPACTAFVLEIGELAARITKGVAPLVAKAERCVRARRAALAAAQAEWADAARTPAMRLADAVTEAGQLMRTLVAAAGARKETAALIDALRAAQGAIGRTLSAAHAADADVELPLLRGLATTPIRTDVVGALKSKRSASVSTVVSSPPTTVVGVSSKAASLAGVSLENSANSKAATARYKTAPPLGGGGDDGDNVPIAQVVKGHSGTSCVIS